MVIVDKNFEQGNSRVFESSGVVRSSEFGDMLYILNCEEMDSKKNVKVKYMALLLLLQVNLAQMLHHHNNSFSMQVLDRLYSS
jgi:hypothetical protein